VAKNHPLTSGWPPSHTDRTLSTPISRLHENSNGGKEQKEKNESKPRGLGRGGEEKNQGGDTTFKTYLPRTEKAGKGGRPASTLRVLVRTVNK